MERVINACWLSLVVWSSAVGADYIRIDVDTLHEKETSEWKFYVLRECPEPELIMGASNGFELHAVGNATWDFPSTGGYTPFPDHLTVWNVDGLQFDNRIAGTGRTEGWFITLGTATAGQGGMPIYTTEKFWFSLEMTIGDLPYGSSGDGIEIRRAVTLPPP